MEQNEVTNVSEEQVVKMSREEAMLKILNQIGINEDTNLITKVAVKSKNTIRGMVPCKYRPNELRFFMKAPNRSKVPETIQMSKVRIVKRGDIRDDENPPIIEFVSKTKPDYWGNSTENTYQMALIELNKNNDEDFDEDVDFE
jgi:hypothetical protein